MAISVASGRLYGYQVEAGAVPGRDTRFPSRHGQPAPVRRYLRRYGPNHEPDIRRAAIDRRRNGHARFACGRRRYWTFVGGQLWAPIGMVECGTRFGDLSLSLLLDGVVVASAGYTDQGSSCVHISNPVDIPGPVVFDELFSSFVQTSTDTSPNTLDPQISNLRSSSRALATLPFRPGGARTAHATAGRCRTRAVDGLQPARLRPRQQRGEKIRVGVIGVR